MSLRYLFGPNKLDFCPRHLPRAIARGDCLPFDSSMVQALRSWDDLQQTFPAGWQPDFVAVFLPYATIPSWLWDAPVPLVGLAGDAQLLWHSYQPYLASLERVLSDAPSVERLHRAGVDQARTACLYGLSREYLDEQLPDGPREIDALFLGNCQKAIQRERLQWLGRLADCGDRWRIQIATNIFDDKYRDLLRRARIVFNRSIRGEANQRTFEAIACGALLFQERSNSEVPLLLRDRQECVFYDESDFSSLLDFYLNREDERIRIVEAARARLPEFAYEAFWEKALAEIEADLPKLRERVARRQKPTGRDALLGLASQGLSAIDGGGATLIPALESVVESGPADANLLNMLGALRTLHAGKNLARQDIGRAADYFKRALAAEPNHLIAALNLVETFVALEQHTAAGDACRVVLATLECDRGSNPSWLQAGRFPPSFDLFRVEWERAGWDHPGDLAGEVRVKRQLIRWRLHSILAELTGNILHYHEAAVIRPDLPPTQASLGCALGRGSRPDLAVSHLRAAVEADPFDSEAARALFQSLIDTKDVDGARRLARHRRLLQVAGAQFVAADNWFMTAPPAADELASIIILCCNEVEFTRQCLESVLRHTLSRYELILMDNGSTDGTPAYLAELSRRPEPVRVVVLRNEHNRGFPAGCNQALREARGRLVVFLNNDTVVTPGWLDGLASVVTYDWPKVGLVGAVTNNAPGPQCVPPGYDNLAGLDGYSRRRAQEFGGKALEHPLLTGFCLLARREVLDQVGGFDERFGLGLFEDDDLCMKVGELGYRLLIAQGVYVHHHGSRTFAGLALDKQQRLQENWLRFRDKWGEERTARYRMPEGGRPAPIQQANSRPPALPPDRPYTGSVSMVMIVKNEEKNIGDCLLSVRGLFPEIIVQDTGSTDRTKEIAREMGAKVFESSWPDSFAAARNLAQSHASGDFIFWMDADDRLSKVDYEKMQALLASLKELKTFREQNVAFRMKCVCLPDPISQTTTVVDHVRMFRNWPDMRWQFRVHEQILWSVRAYNGEVRFANVVITHTGYQDPALRGRKLERDLKLLYLDLQDDPDHPYLLFNLASILQEQGRYEESIRAVQGSLARSDPSDSIVRKLYAMLAGSHKALGQTLPALAAVRDGRKVYPQDIELLFREASLLKELGNYSSAEASCLELFAAPPPQGFASVDAGLQGYKGRYLLGEICRLQHRPEAAAAQWKLAAADNPGFGPAWHGLASIALERKDRSLFDEAIAGLSKFANGRLEVELLEGQWLMVTGNLAGAVAHAKRLAKEYPQSTGPLVLRGRALLHLGGERERIEWAWRDVLTLDAANPEALNTLVNLLRDRTRSESAYFQAQAELTGWVLEKHYEAACTSPSEIQEHLPALLELATGCKRCTAFGTRNGLAVLALLSANPEAVACYDNLRPDVIEKLKAMTGSVRLTFHKDDVLSAEVAETDLLFIDANHSYEQRKLELARHSSKVRKYIVLAQTTRFAESGEGAGQRGIWPAVEEFLSQGTFRLKKRYENNNGWTVLERVQMAEGSADPFIHVEAPASAQEARVGMEPATTMSQPLKIVWEGGFAEEHSLALVNRELCSRLVARGHQLQLVPQQLPPSANVPRLALPSILARCLGAALPDAPDVTIRHAWPPDLTPPPRGRWVVMQPWEFGALPRAWLEPFRRADEIWVPTNHVRDGFVASGLSTQQVHVVPLGVDIARFHPQAAPYRLKTQRRFKFLFVGGTIHRKGIDLLMDAFLRGFKRSDEVCLVIKDMGGRSFYQGQTYGARIEALRSQPATPEIEYLDQSLTPEEMAGLYTACDCLVHPYRGEGFGLPIAEAMAAGRAVIVTGPGASRDFCNESNAYLLPARVVEMKENSLGSMETVGRPWLLEPDAGTLVERMRHVVQHPDEARAKGSAASAHIRANWTWDHAAAVMERRLQTMVTAPAHRRP